MEDKNNITTIKNLVATAKSVIVILPPDPSKDMVIAGASLHLALKASGKASQIGCGSEIHIDPNIDGFSEIASTIGSRNLVISFDYSEDNLDKVDYDVRDDGKFYLLVKPKANAPVPDIHDVKFSYSGASADLVITLGISSLEELGKIYADEKNFLDAAETININNSLRPAAFTGNIYHKNLISFSEIISGFIEEVGLKADSQTAQQLLNNIYESTNNLSSGHLSADTFTSIAFLMRSGAHIPQKEAQMPHLSQPTFFEVPSAPEEEEIPLPEEPDQPIPQPIPSDWSKPKIFRVAKKTS